MDRVEFLSVLRQSLEGYVPMDEVEKNMEFYREYFDKSDLTEKEVVEELGDPRLIAKTVIDAYKASKGPMADFYTQQAQREFQQEHSQQYTETEDEEGEFYMHRGGLLANIVFWVIVIGVLILALTFLSFLAKILLPIVLLIIVIKIAIDYFGS